MKKIICDRCGRELRSYENYEVSIEACVFHPGDLASTDFDLCEDCTRMFIRAFKEARA